MAVCTQANKPKEQKMQTIETLENQIATRTEINSPSVIWAYVITKETGNEHLDLPSTFPTLTCQS